MLGGEAIKHQIVDIESLHIKDHFSTLITSVMENPHQLIGFSINLFALFFLIEEENEGRIGGWLPIPINSELILTMII